MDISLSNSLESILQQKVSEGIFKTMDEAVSFAVQFTFIDNNISQERIESLNAAIEKGWIDMESNLGRSSEEVFGDLRKKYV